MRDEEADQSRAEIHGVVRGLRKGDALLVQLPRCNRVVIKVGETEEDRGPPDRPRVIQLGRDRQRFFSPGPRREGIVEERSARSRCKGARAERRIAVWEGEDGLGAPAAFEEMTTLEPEIEHRAAEAKRGVGHAAATAPQHLARLGLSLHRCCAPRAGQGRPTNPPPVRHARRGEMPRAPLERAPGSRPGGRRAVWRAGARRPRSGGWSPPSSRGAAPALRGSGRALCGAAAPRRRTRIARSCALLAKPRPYWHDRRTRECSAVASCASDWITFCDTDCSTK